MKCISDECDRDALTKGCCDKHYRRLLKYGDINQKHGKPKAGMKCEVNGCDKPVKGDGLCCGHYSRLRRHGSPFGGTATRGHVAKWMKKIIETKDQDCIVWPFYRMDTGYGQVTYNGKTQSAHRCVLILKDGEPEGIKEALHSCGNGHLGCVNPNHLRWGTSAENSADMEIHGTRLRGAKVIGSKLDEEKVYKILERIDKGERKIDLANEYGVVPSVITKISKRFSWAHVEYPRKEENVN